MTPPYRFQSCVLLAMTMMMTILMTSHATHFRGGTIGWQTMGGRKVRFNFKLGWRYGQGPGCSETKIGQYVTKMSHSYWECLSGCHPKPKRMSNVNYFCSGASKKEGWEQGQNSFTYTFPNDGPFIVGYKFNNWIRLSNGKGGGAWNVATEVDLRTRSDTGTANNSPESTSKPSYFVEYDCQAIIRIPIVDRDGDRIRCRWATGSECESVCNALPGAQLDTETCTLTFDVSNATGYDPNGVYAAALTIEDFPTTNITIGTTQKTPNDVMTSIPMQFLVQTRGPSKSSSSSSCDTGPRFVPPTPQEKGIVTVVEGNTVKVGLYADNGNDTTTKPDKITVSGPPRTKLSKVIPYGSLTNTFYTTLSWVTIHKNIGDHIVCANVENENGRSGNQRCFTIRVVSRVCQSSPCQNGGKCITLKGGYSCRCLPGFSGINCQNAPSTTSPTTTTSTTTASTRAIPTPTTKTPSSSTTTTTATTTTTFVAGTTPSTTKTTTTISPNTSASSRTTAKGTSHPTSQPASLREYNNCTCSIKSSSHQSTSSHPSTREISLFSIGLPFGIVMSVFTYQLLIQFLERRGNTCWNLLHPRPLPKCWKTK